MVLESPLGDPDTPKRDVLCGVVEGFYGRPWTTDQRKKLFERMNVMQMNTYLYAPKDDSKHRVYWRELYSVEEADHLTGLIKAAQACNVTFVYAISPGLDMTYSSAKEVTLLKRKLEQVQSFGCKAFALLFDDIEVDMSEADKEHFQSFAQAQVSVTNEVYQHLHQPPLFMFCPTEYCAARAVPDVKSSEYLTTLGNKLLNNIDIMWTGPKVVSKIISIKSVEELTSVLKRPPVIWDNIHANDYDQKRLFLGPYDGRSPELLPYIRGVLTNPNCEFEANFIAMHTLAQWCGSTYDIPREDLPLSSSPVSSDIKLEAEDEWNPEEDILYRPGEGRYHPKSALVTAISDWMTEFYQEASPVTKKIVNTTPPVPIVPVNTPNTCMSLAMSTTTPSAPSGTSSQALPIPIANANVLAVQNLNELTHVEMNDSHLQPMASHNPISSLVDPLTSDNETESDSLEPMDCNITPGSTPTSSDILSSTNASSIGSVISEMEKTSSVCSSQPPQSDIDTMQIDMEPVITASEQIIPVTTSERLSMDDIALIVDLFYLPFEHGSKAECLLNELGWLKSNAHVVCDGKKDTASSEEVVTLNHWQDRAYKFREEVCAVCDVLDKFIGVPNKALLYDLYPYVWDMKNVLQVLMTFTDWLALGHVPYVSVYYMQRNPYTWSNQVYRDAFSSGANEPWVFRGGLQAEFQRLLPVEGIADLLTPVFPSIPVSAMYTVRPYQASDRDAVYNICQKCYEKDKPTPLKAGHEHLAGDAHIGAFLDLSAEYCFVVLNDSKEICGYVVGALDARLFYEKVETSWLPAMKRKYPIQSEDLISQIHKFDSSVPEALFKSYPSLMRTELLPGCNDDLGAIKRAVACTIMSLKVNGSHGVHSIQPTGHKENVDFYNKLGLFELSKDEYPTSSVDTAFIARMV